MRTTIALLFFLSSTVSSYAFYNGNPATPHLVRKGMVTRDNNPLVSGTLGFLYDDTNNRKLRKQGNNKERFERFEIVSTMAEGSMVILNQFQIFAMLGATEMSALQRVDSATCLQYMSEQDIAYAAGARLLFLEINHWGLGAILQYMQSFNGFNYLTKNGQYVEPTQGRKPKINYREWQVGLGVSYSVRFMSAYLGLSFTEVRSKIKGLPNDFYVRSSGETLTRFSLQNQIKPGLFTGVSVVSNDTVMLNFEGRFLDTVAFGLSGTIRF